MRNRFRLLESIAISQRNITARRRISAALSGYDRRLACETLEDRRLLSTSWPGGPILEDTTWTAANGPYDLVGNVYVRSGATLRIESGVQVQGSALYIDDDSSGGSLSATNADFQNTVYLYPGASALLRGNRFVSGKVYVAPQLAASLDNNTFPANATVNVLGGTLSGSATLPAIANVAKYDLTGILWVQSGGSLTIASRNTITGSILYVNSDGSGGSLSADEVSFQNSVYLYPGASALLRGNRFVSGKVYVAPQLAASLVNNTFPANATVNVLGGTLSGSATLPAIANVVKYDLTGILWVQSGGSLTIAGGNTITGSILYVSSDGSGGILAAQGVTFNNQLFLGPGSAGVLVFDKFTYAGYNYFDGRTLITVRDNDFAGSKAGAQGTGGPIDLEGNYWGTTDLIVIGQTKIYDHADSTFVPVIDFGSPRSDPPVPPVEARQRQISRLSPPTFDGAGNDITLWLGDVIAGQQVEVWAGQTADDYRSLGSFTNTAGITPWTVSVDIHGANLPRAEYVAVTSDQPLIVLSAEGVHPDPADLTVDEQYAAIPAAEPRFEAGIYDHVARLYRWNRAADGPSFVALPEEDWKNPGTIDWSKKTVVLTHGWNGRIEQNDADRTAQYIWNFATNLGNASDLYNVLAVDWYDGGSRYGSDPDNVPLTLTMPWNLLNGDAMRSAQNGTLAAEGLARRLLHTVGAADLHPEKMMLIGHSNGAGFMASMALTFYKQSAGKVAELVALDAPTATSAWDKVFSAADAGISTSNYYMALAAGGLGARITSDSVVNFRLEQVASMREGAWNIGHLTVPERYARTADSRSQWGFQASVFVNGESSFKFESSDCWYESLEPGVFYPKTDLALTADALQEDLQSHAFGSLARGVWNVYDAGVRLVQNVAEAWKGVNSSIWVTGLTHLPFFAAHSPAYGSIDVNIPADADLLTFTLSVIDPGNDDRLLVAIDSDVLQETNLGEVRSTGGLKAVLGVKSYAGQSATLTFYMPSDVPSSAEFVLSEIQFVDVDFPPGASFDSNAVAVTPSAATFSVTYADPEDSLALSTIGAENVLVTGPNGFSQLASVVTVDQVGDDSARTVTYRVSAPGGVWTQAYKGTYTVWMRPDQVGDSGGQHVPAGVLGAFAIDTVANVLGPITFVELPGQSLSGGALWYSCRTTQPGLLTVEAIVPGGGTAQVELFDAEGRPLGVSSLKYGTQRVEHVAGAAGETYFLRLTGTAAVDLRLTNLVSQSGGEVSVSGTDAPDAFEYRAATRTAVIRGVRYDFSGTVSRVSFSGGGGSDTATVYGTTADETYALAPGRLRKTTGFWLADIAAETITVSGSGGDVANLSGRAGAVDKLRLASSSAAMSAADGSYANTVYGFHTVNATSSAGDSDEARFYDSTDSDTFSGRPTYALMTRTGFSNKATGFAKVYAYATATNVSGATDRANLYDSTRSDTFYGYPTYAYLTGTGFYNYANGFDKVYAYATATNLLGATDRANLYDSTGADTFYGYSAYAYLTGAAFYNYAGGFDKVYAYATAKNVLGATDRANLYDSTGSDRFYGYPTYAYLYGTGFSNYAGGFDKVYAYATAANLAAAKDRAFHYDSPGNDKFYGRTAYGYLFGTGFYYYATGFDEVTANGTKGGTNRLDIAALDYLFQHPGNWT